MALLEPQADDPPQRLLSRRGGLALAAAALLATGVLGCGGGDTSPGEPAADAASSGAPAATTSTEASPAPLLGDGDHVVFIGDSLVTQSPPTYADLLPAAAARDGIRGVDVTNLGEPGSTSADWLPGSTLYDLRLAPQLPDADLVLVTVGGNDLQEALGANDGVAAAADGSADSAGAALDAIDQTGRNLKRTFAAIRQANPDVQIAYVAYPDYSASSAWKAAAGYGGSVALGIGLSSQLAAARDAGPDQVIDMMSATAEHGVDPLLGADPEYLSAAGHRFYAERIAAALSEPPPAG